MLEILKKLCELPSAPGMEKGILDFVINNYTNNCEYSLDGMGNLTVIKKCGKENAEAIAICAKADTDGFIVNYIEDNGFLRVTKLGSPNAYSCAFTELVSEKGVHGFTALEKDAEIKNGEYTKLYIDIGASSKMQAEKLVGIGDIFAGIPSVKELSNGRIGGFGAAQRMPLAILLYILSNVKSENYDLIFTICVQEALGKRGSKTAMFQKDAKLCISLDNCEAFDVPGAQKRGEATLGAGAVIISNTRSYCLEKESRSYLIELCEKHGIKCSINVYPDKVSSASVIAATYKGCSTIELSLASRNLASGAEIFDMSDAESITKLVTAVISE